MDTQVIQGDTLQVLRSFHPGTFDAVINDPPYASGGATKAEREKPSSLKYTDTKKSCPYPDIEGDAKDQRSWTNWMAEWLAYARKASKQNAVVCVFTDWRQLPACTDALQWAGWIWKGVAVWDKISSRPQKGRFKSQCEYIVWGCNGAMPIDRPVPCLPGVFRYSNVQPNVRTHQTEKPLQLMRDIVKICEPGGLILDPFAGSGTTLLAAKLEGYRAVGVELVEHYAGVANRRLQFAKLVQSKLEVI